MANLTIVAADVSPVVVIEQMTAPASETITAGDYVRLNTSTGKAEPGNGSTTAEVRRGGIALTSAGTNETVTYMKRGTVDLGDALGTLAFDADIYVSDTDGLLADSAGTVSRVVGTVEAAWGNTSADRVLRVDL